MMSMTVQSGMRAAYVAAQQQVTAPVRAPRAEAQEKQGGAGPAYTVEISAQAREKYEAAQQGGVPQQNAAQESEAQTLAVPDEGAEETASGEAGEQRGSSPLEARLEKLRKQLTDVRRSVLPEEEKKERVRALKQQIQTLEGQIAEQQKAQNTQSA